MWKLLAELAVIYCGAATWSLAAGDRDKASALVERAYACLCQRKLHGWGENVDLKTVIRGD